MQKPDGSNRQSCLQNSTNRVDVQGRAASLVAPGGEAEVARCPVEIVMIGVPHVMKMTADLEGMMTDIRTGPHATVGDPSVTSVTRNVTARGTSGVSKGYFLKVETLTLIGQACIVLTSKRNLHMRYTNVVDA